MDVVSKEISNYTGKKDKDVKILLSITGIDIFSPHAYIFRNSQYRAIFHTLETGKLCCRTSTFYKRISWKDINRCNNQTGFTVVKMDIGKCALIAIKYDHRLRTFYTGIKNRKGHGKAIVIATAKELLVIIWGIC
jgi:hypothetical protein